MSRSNFQRSQSRVWYGNGTVPDNPFYGGAFGTGSGYYFHYNQLQEGRQPSSLRPSMPIGFQDLDEEEELLLEQQIPEKQTNSASANISGISSTSNISARVGSTVWNESNRQGSPASHKSQDSGFSDTELSPNMPSIGNNTSSHSKNFNENQSSPDKLTPKRTINEQLFQRSPSISSEVSTPPTVIRRPAPDITREEITVRRISYSEPNSPSVSPPSPYDDLVSKIDSLNFDNTSPLETSQLSIRINATEDEAGPLSLTSSSTSSCHCPSRSSGSSLKRGRVITKCSRVKRNLNNQLRDSEEEMISLDSSELTNILNQTLSQDVTLSNLNTPKSILKTPPSYNNETVLLGYVSPDRNNNLRNDDRIPTREKELPTYAELYPNGTSTPIMYQPKFYRSLPPTPTRTQRSPVKFRPTKLIDNFYEEPDVDLTNQRLSQQTDLNFTEYENPLLNGHTPAVQSWLDGLRFSYQSEVMSILQTKSISVEATRNVKMTSATAVKLIRHLQSKVVDLQGEFEKVEKVFASIKRYQQQQDEDDEDDEKEIYQKAAPLVQSLAANIYQFVQKQKSNDYFGKDPLERADLKKFHENTQSLVDMTTDLRTAAANGEEFDYRSVEEEVQIIKRYFLITTRLIFKNLVKVIVDTIEDSKCDLILRSNLSYVSMLSNLDYQGLASLNDAFISNGTVRALLIVCIECKFSSIRALALRALATVCSTTETIRQLEKADGVEILRDILADQRSNERSEPEFREAVSVLTQITAPWHGDDHRIDGLKQHVHAIVEAVTEIVDKTTCCQTLLLCSACLNNLTRIEATAVYSLMSHETTGKLKAAAERRGPGASVFLFEQITSMLFNMSSNKKSHHHLASRPLITFLTGTFNQKFYERMDSRVETEAQRKTIKNILHVLSRLVVSGAIGSHDELLESTIVPIFSRIQRTLDDRNEHFRDISLLNRRLNESLSGGTPKTTPPPATLSILTTTATSTANPFVTRLTIERRPNGGIVMVDNNRQESYV